MTALLVTEHSNVHYVHATRSAGKPGYRGALVFNLDRADLTEKVAQEPSEHFKI